LGVFGIRSDSSVIVFLSFLELQILSGKHFVELRMLRDFFSEGNVEPPFENLRLHVLFHGMEIPVGDIEVPVLLRYVIDDVPALVQFLILLSLDQFQSLDVVDINILAHVLFPDKLFQESVKHFSQVFRFFFYLFEIVYLIQVVEFDQSSVKKRFGSVFYLLDIRIGQSFPESKIVNVLLEFPSE